MRARKPVFSRLDVDAENRKADARLEAADRWVKAMGEVLSELTPVAAENAALAFVREHPGTDAKHAVRVFQRAARVETARVNAKRNRYQCCRIPILTVVGRGTLGGDTLTKRWERTTCNVPLFSTDDREHGLCRSCTRDRLDPGKLYRRDAGGETGITHTEITDAQAGELLAIDPWTAPNH
jgi:hypothetical protein